MQVCSEKFSDPLFLKFLTHSAAGTFIAMVENMKCVCVIKCLSASLGEDILSQAIWL